ncbi:MAG: hypothetical protein HON94_08280 [Methylococcales bacterium]|jgi:hypothetical protein|nr:hypothetical protein [Methylococcales bacterium]
MPNDISPKAEQARCVNSFDDLNGIEFIGQVGWEKDQYDDFKCVIKTIITPDHKDYAQLMGKVVVNAPPQATNQTHLSAVPVQINKPAKPVPNGVPDWAS